MKVLVVGAGIAGLAAARALSGRLADVELHVVERDAAPSPEGTGIFLTANAVRALRMLGLAEPALSVRIDTYRTANQRGRVFYELDTDDLWGGIGPSVATHRAELSRALLDSVDGGIIRWGIGPRTIMPDGDGVDVTFDDGTEGRYDLVVGADGVHSTVRRLAFADDGLLPRSLYARRWIGQRQSPEPVWSARLGVGVMFLALPIGPDTAYHYCGTGPAAADAKLPEILAGFAAPVPEIADAATDVHFGQIEEVALASWTRGRVLLVGDAAHATSPNMAQGAAMGLEDALVLADALCRAESIPAALQAYEQRRRPRVEWIQRHCRRRDNLAALTPVVRDPLMRMLGRRLFRAGYRGLDRLP